KNRKATNTPRPRSQFGPKKKSSNVGSKPVFRKIIATQAQKHTGSAVISSSTIEPGSFWSRIFSPAPHSQTENPMPAVVAAPKIQIFSVRSSSANHSTPIKEPNNPGANGTRPT